MKNIMAIKKIFKNSSKILLITALFFIFGSQILMAQFGVHFSVHKDIVKIKLFKSLDKIIPGSEFKLAVEGNVAENWHINSNKPKEKFLIPTKLSVDTSFGFNIKKIVYPEAKDIKLSFSEKPLSVWKGKFIIGALVNVTKNIKPGTYPLIVKLDYQACNNLSCLPPTLVEDTISVVVGGKKAVINEINQDIFNKINLSYSGVTSSISESSNTVTSRLEHSGLFLGLLLIFIGGLALNLTPCVYPLIPITIGYFGGQSEGKTHKLFLMGLLFVIGLAITYSIIGVITALSGAFFGSIMQSTFVIIFIALIFVALSLSMFGVYEFKLPDSWVAKAGGTKRGYYGAVFMGLTTGIVAAPCIAPFVLGLVTYVATIGNPYYGFLVFFILALGMGLPYLFLSIFSGKIKNLPKSGEWMETVKHIFGFIILGMALYYILPLLPKSISGIVLPIYMILVGIYLLLFAKLGDKVRGFKISKIVFSLIIIAIAVYFIIPSQKNSINWKPYSENLLSTELKEHKAIIIDFSADWCIPCKELDATTFSDPKVIALSRRFSTLRADMTKSLSQQVEQLRQKYKILGVPTILILNSKGHETKRIIGYIGPKKFYKLLNQIE